MKRLLLIAIALVALVWPASGGAHPLGNFTVNHYAEILLSGDRVYVTYALDLAEIPTFQEGEAVRSPEFARRLADDLVLEIDGRRARLTPVEHEATSSEGAGGLETLRFDAVYEAEAAPGSSLAFRDESFDGRLGWREIVVRAEEGTQIASSSAPAESVSGGLRSYPSDLLSSPLDVREARVEYEPGSSAGPRSVARRLVRPRARSGRGSSRWSRRRTSASASCSSRCSWRCSGARLTRSPRATARPSSPAISSDPGGQPATPSTSA